MPVNPGVYRGLRAVASSVITDTTWWYPCSTSCAYSQSHWPLTSLVHVQAHQDQSNHGATSAALQQGQKEAVDSCVQRLSMR